MKTQLFKIILTASVFYLLPYCVCAQEIIQIEYNAENNSIDSQNLPDKVRHNKKYTLIINHINSAHIAPLSEVTTSRFVSDIPDILRSIYVGIPNNAAGSNLPLNAPVKRAIYQRASAYFRDLAAIQRISDDLYQQTRFRPNAAIAKAKKQELFQALSVNSIQEAYARTVLAKEYIQVFKRFITHSLDKLIYNMKKRQTFSKNLPRLKLTIQLLKQWITPIYSTL